MKLYLIAGEASGDLHGANLVHELKKKFTNAQFRGFGGDLMKAEGVHLTKHYRELAFMGFSEVLLNLRTIFRNFSICKQDIKEWKPDAVILIDYPGFNIRMAEFIHRAGIKVIYYISPQLWAWHESRVKRIKRYVDRMLVILPFEKEFYAKHGMQVTFVGHPLLDAIERNNQEPITSSKPVIALLPGSRKQEITRMLPVMLKMIPFFPEYEFIVAGAPSVPEQFYRSLMQDHSVRIVFNQTYPLLRMAKAAIVTSGTATLETALHHVPLMVCYSGNSWSYFLARRLVKVRYISLVNLIAGKQVARELIQHDMNEHNMRNELNRLLKDVEYRTAMLSNFRELATMLGESGASGKAASAIAEFIQKPSDF
jgi:lipid-A-disaccharide synthase